MNAILKSFCCVLVFAAPGVFAQEFRATISGDVTDQSGSVVAGAKVLALSLERNIPYDAVTNSAGRYVIQFLLPGKYTVEAIAGEYQSAPRIQAASAATTTARRFTYGWCGIGLALHGDRGVPERRTVSVRLPSARPTDTTGPCALRPSSHPMRQ